MLSLINNLDDFHLFNRGMSDITARPCIVDVAMHIIPTITFTRDHAYVRVKLVSDQCHLLDCQYPIGRRVGLYS
jgi:hypothetical protein